MIQIRKCCADDFDEVLVLLRQLWTDKRFNAKRLKKIFDSALVSDSKTYLCALNGNRVVGFASFTKKKNLWPEGPLGYVDELVVDSGYRSKGVGALLLGQLVTLARSNGCCRIELDCAFYRKDAYRFYEREGFASRAFVFSKVL
jgi:GNAT superfamily N-acetyltransferase